MHQGLKGYVLAIITICIWSSTFLVSKILLESLTPFQILIIRFIIAIIVLSIIYPKFIMKKDIQEEFIFLIIGGCLALYFYFENSALKYTYSSNVSLIVSTIPMITGIMSVIVYKKPFFNIKSIIGFILAYGGVAAIILNGSKIEGIEPIGDVFALLAALMFSLYTIVMHRVQKGYHIIALTRKVFVYSLIVMIGLALISNEPMIIQKINGPIFMSILFLGIVASSFAFILWNKAIELVGSVMTNQFIYLIPVVTTILSVAFMGEELTWIKFFGGLCIIGGLYLSEKSQAPNEIEREEIMV